MLDWPMVLVTYRSQSARILKIASHIPTSPPAQCPTALPRPPHMALGLTDDLVEAPKAMLTGPSAPAMSRLVIADSTRLPVHHDSGTPSANAGPRAAPCLYAQLELWGA